MRRIPVGQQVGLAGRLSPYLRSQRGVLNAAFLPLKELLPTEGLLTNSLTFDFGFNPGSPGLSALDTQNITLQMEHNFIGHTIVGYSNDRTGPGGTNSGFLVTFFHTHNGTQRRFFSKHLNSSEIMGSAQGPIILLSPILLLKGDSLECEVKNLGNPVPPALTAIQVCLVGGEFG